MEPPFRRRTLPQTAARPLLGALLLLLFTTPPLFLACPGKSGPQPLVRWCLPALAPITVENCLALPEVGAWLAALKERALDIECLDKLLTGRFCCSLENDFNGELHVERFARANTRSSIEVANGVAY